ncbi:MAG: hypothetical protein V3W34_13135, partial [Phycisphaerae bacterium]
DDPFRVGWFGGGAIRGRRYACPRLLQSRPSACHPTRRFCHGPCHPRVFLSLVGNAIERILLI